LGDDARVLINLESWMDTPHRRIRIGIRRETVKIKPVEGVLNSSIERLELIALERSGLVSVFELNDDASFLYVSNPKSLMGERREERRTLGEVVEFLAKRVLTGSEGHLT
jgi:hypothetical protein